jgi:hypothetical protein
MKARAEKIENFSDSAKQAQSDSDSINWQSASQWRQLENRPKGNPVANLKDIQRQLRQQMFEGGTLQTNRDKHWQFWAGTINEKQPV